MYRPKNIAHSANTENCWTPRYNSPLRDVKTNLLQAVHEATLSLIAGEEVTPTLNARESAGGARLALSIIGRAPRHVSYLGDFSIPPLLSEEEGPRY